MMTFLSSPSTKRLVLFALAPVFVFLVCLICLKLFTPAPVENEAASPAADTDVSSLDTDLSSKDTDVSPPVSGAPSALPVVPMV